MGLQKMPPKRGKRWRLAARCNQRLNGTGLQPQPTGCDVADGPVRSATHERVQQRTGSSAHDVHASTAWRPEHMPPTTAPAAQLTNPQPSPGVHGPCAVLGGQCESVLSGHCLAGTGVSGHKHRAALRQYEHGCPSLKPLRALGSGAQRRTAVARCGRGLRRACSQAAPRGIRSQW